MCECVCERENVGVWVGVRESKFSVRKLLTIGGC